MEDEGDAAPGASSMLIIMLRMLLIMMPIMMLIMMLVMMLIMLLIYSTDLNAAADNPAVADNAVATTSKLVNQEQLLVSLP